MDSPLHPKQCALLPPSDAAVPPDAFEAHLVAGTIGIVQTIEALGYDCEYTPSGSLTLLDSFEHGNQIDYLSHYTAQLRHEHAIGANEAVSVVSLLNPPMGAIHHPHSCHVNPLAFTQHLATLAAKRGATVHEHTHLTQCTHNPRTHTYTLHDNHGRTHVADTVVLATGVYQDDVERVFGVRAPVVAVKGTMWAYDDDPSCEDTPPPMHPPPILYSTRSLWRWAQQPCTQLPLTRSPHDVHFYTKTDAHGVLHVGGQRVRTTEHDPCDTLEADFARVRYTVEHLLPELHTRLLWGGWSGLMPFGAQNQVVVRELSADELPNVWLVNGFGAHGIMLAPMAMALVSGALVWSPTPPMAR